ncbi:MAG: response regulator transcription factor [Chloroflexaceae bacterium]|nr:response regulator transcription factor [Chloroflexaceae bacterium]
MNMRILVVDDEPQMRRMLKTGLSVRGYEVMGADDGLAALDAIVSWRPDVVVLDLGLPVLDGLEVCRRVRGWSQVPIIVLSVRDQEQDKVTALDLGADDYLTKPFGMDELLARIRVALRHAARLNATEEPVCTFGDLQIDRAHRRVTVRGQEIHLTPTEYELLHTLTAHAGKVLTHRWLLRTVWGPAYEQDTPTLRVFMTQLRHKIESVPAKPCYILTEPGIGYRFNLQG